MGNAVRVSGAFLSAFACLAGTGALAERDAATAHSPYSLGLSVGRTPFMSSCPATLLYCAPSQGLNLSVVGRAQMSSFGVFGMVGATSYTRPDTSVMGMGVAPAPVAEQGGGLSWGGGVSWNFTPRLSASFEWVSYDLKVPGGPVRSTSLGLKYRY